MNGQTIDAGWRCWSGLHGHGGCSQRGGLQFSSWQEQSHCGLLSWNVNKAADLHNKTELRMKMWTSLVAFFSFFLFFGKSIVVGPGFFVFIHKFIRLPVSEGRNGTEELW